MASRGERVQEMDFVGIWRDNLGRIIIITKQLESGNWRGIRKNPDPLVVEPEVHEYTKFLGVNIKDGSRLMERKRGEEAGWD